MRVDATLCKNVAGLENLSVRNFDSGTIGDQISLGVSCLLVRNDDLTFFLCIFNCNNTTEFSDDRKSLRASGLEKLLDTGKTLCDIAAGNTAGVECTHGQLCTRLTDGLCGNDTNSLSDLYRLKRGYVVDYFSIQWKKLKKVVFNLGDIFIFAGSALFAAVQLVEELREILPKEKIFVKEEE